jgi:alanine dehydrogenase
MTEEPKTTGFTALAQETALYPQEKLAKIGKNKKSFFIGIPKEISFQENRISLTPDAVDLLVKNGHQVWIESGAAEKAKFKDSDYSEAGAKIVYSTEELYQANVILKIEPPTLGEIEMFKPGQTLISALQIGNQTAEYIKALKYKRVTALAYEFIEDKVGGFPIIRAMSEIAGSTAIMVASEFLSSVHQGKGILLGGITGVPPTKVLIIGGGTVAEHAARSALGLGAEVKIFDNHLYKLRRLKHILGNQIYTSTIDTVTLAECLKSTDVLIGALRGDTGRANIVVSEEMVMNMKPDSLIIDLSIDQGGCVETSKLTTLEKPTFKMHDVIHYCVPNIASRVAHTATTALSNIFTPTILRAGAEGGIEDMVFNHSWFMKGVYTFNGSLTNEHIAKKFGLECRDLSLLRVSRF